MYPSARVKYLGVKIDANFTLQYHVNDLSPKLNKAFAPLFRIRKFVHDETVRSIYFIFESNLYCYSFYGLKMLVLFIFLIKYVYKYILNIKYLNMCAYMYACACMSLRL